MSELGSESVEACVLLNEFDLFRIQESQQKHEKVLLEVERPTMGSFNVPDSTMHFGPK